VARFGGAEPFIEYKQKRQDHLEAKKRKTAERRSILMSASKREQKESTPGAADLNLALPREDNED